MIDDEKKIKVIVEGTTDHDFTLDSINKCSGSRSHLIQVTLNYTILNKHDKVTVLTDNITFSNGVMKIKKIKFLL